MIVGRTPLRPIPGENRLDIDDPLKSMSKRHLRFSVDERGEGRIQDLQSTNGSYIVRSDGELMRLPLDEAYPLTDEPLRLQLGDVAVEIHQETLAVKHADSLFAHAAPAVPEGVDSPSLSVDDILDARQGEPTEMFNAASVREQVAQKKPEESASDFAQMKVDLERQNSEQRAEVEASGAGFEPGSVLDRLTKGQMHHEEPAVRIGDYTSDDAQHSTDENAQFDMAQHHEFLAYLALNPHLYDDLFAWLEAIGDPDITAALAANSGYATYRENRR